MPMIDALWPEDALTPEAEARLVKELTDILIKAEGYDASNPTAQRVTVSIFIGRLRSTSGANARPRYATGSFRRYRKGNTPTNRVAGSSETSRKRWRARRAGRSMTSRRASGCSRPRFRMAPGGHAAQSGRCPIFTRYWPASLSAARALNASRDAAWRRRASRSMPLAQA